MKQKDFEGFTSDELRDTRNYLTGSYLEVHQGLSEEIKTFITTEREIGNNFTRIGRCINLIDREIVKRFINKTL